MTTTLQPPPSHQPPSSALHSTAGVAVSDPTFVRRAKAIQDQHEAAVRSGTAKVVEFNPTVPATAAGSRLKQIFKDRGIKQTEIARKLGVAPSVISRVFKHPERSRLQTIRNIADAAGISLRELI